MFDFVFEFQLPVSSVPLPGGSTVNRISYGNYGITYERVKLKLDATVQWNTLSTLQYLLYIVGTEPVY